MHLDPRSWLRGAGCKQCSLSPGRRTRSPAYTCARRFVQVRGTRWTERAAGRDGRRKEENTRARRRRNDKGGRENNNKETRRRDNVRRRSGVHSCFLFVSGWRSRNDQPRITCPSSTRSFAIDRARSSRAVKEYVRERDVRLLLDLTLRILLLLCRHLTSHVFQPRAVTFHHRYV